MRLVDDWKRVHTFATARIAYGMVGLGVLGPIIASSWSLIPPDLREAMPANAKQAIAWVIFGLLILGARHVTATPRRHDDGNDNCK